MTNSAAVQQDDIRRHQRVNVELRGVMRIPDAGIAQINTVNLSESGMLAKVLDKPTPKIDTAVYLQLNGILFNEDGPKNPIYKMRVVHAIKDSIGLQFI